MKEGRSRASIREVREKLATSEQLAGQSARRFDEVARRFESFCHKGFGVAQLADVLPAHVEAFVRAKADGKDPAPATMHMRRTALRLLFRTARSEFALDGDPTLDLVLPPKSGLATRPLTDDEIALGRSYALHNLTATRGPAAWALGEATAITSELPYITTNDLDLDRRRVWLHGSNKRVERWGTLTDWGATQLERRAQALRNITHLIYQGNGSEESALASCCTALKDTLVRSGLDSEPDVRPNSVAAWATKRVHRPVASKKLQEQRGSEVWTPPPVSLVSTGASSVQAVERIEAILGNKAIYELAKLVPQREPGDAGRPRDFPDYMLLVFDALISVFGSARKAEAEIADRNVWHFMRRIIKDVHNNEPEMHLPPYRYRRHHYEYGRNRYLTNPVILKRLQELHRNLAGKQAQELGLLDPEGEGSFTHPNLDRLLYADGKVIAPLYKAQPGTTKLNKETGEIREVRAEADADLHFQGDGETAWGVKFVITAVRSSDVNGRIILDARHCPERGGEAKYAMSALRDLAPQLPGAQGVLYDTALRGVHHAEIMRELGWLSINRVQAAEVITRNGKPVKRTEKATHIEDKIIDDKTVRLFARAGAICVAELDHNGDQILTECKRIKTIRRQDKNNRYRFYNQYALPDGDTVMVRLDTTEQDKARKLNRSENVRQIPPGDPDFKRIYGRRADAESINRSLDDSMWLGRAHSKGAKRQSVNLLGFALMTNGIALYLHRKKQVAAPPGSKAAA